MGTVIKSPQLLVPAEPWEGTFIVWLHWKPIKVYAVKIGELKGTFIKVNGVCAFIDEYGPESGIIGMIPAKEA